jgi:hypothetical protein
MQLDLKVELVSDRKAGVDNRGHRAPILVDLQANAAALHLVDDRAGARGVAAAEEAEIDRPLLGGLKHLTDIEGAAAVNADGDRPERAADHGGKSRADRVLAELRRVEMHVHVDAAGSRNQTLGVAHSRGGADDQIGMDAVHRGGIARLADADDLAVLDADITFDDSEHGVDHERIAQEHVERAHGAVIARGHAKPVAECFAATMQAFLAGNGAVVLDFGKERGVAETDRIASGRAVHVGVVFTAHPCHGLGSLEAALARAGQRRGAV